MLGFLWGLAGSAVVAGAVGYSLCLLTAIVWPGVPWALVLSCPFPAGLHGPWSLVWSTVVLSPYL